VPGVEARYLFLPQAVFTVLRDNCAFGSDASSARRVGIAPVPKRKRRKRPAAVQFGCFCGFLLAFSAPISGEVER
jgi:hypothetical protein